MQAEPRENKVCVWMTKGEAQNLLREIDKWPELPKFERDLVNALKELLGDPRFSLVRRYPLTLGIAGQRRRGCGAAPDAVRR